MAIETLLESLKVKAYSSLDIKTRSALGQYYTPYAVSQFMASLFKSISGNVHLLDPGCGVGSLTAAFVEEGIDRNQQTNLECTLVDIENKVSDLAKELIEHLKLRSNLKVNHFVEDFIMSAENLIFNKNGSRSKQATYTHCIMNPPYKRIPAKSPQRQTMKRLGINSDNLYSAFLSIALRSLAHQGELVAIIPRSFCNGPYFSNFREQLLNEASIEHIHIFNSRSKTFKGDKVLQENIIIHLIKGGKQGDVVISSSTQGDFAKQNNITYSASDMAYRTVQFSDIVKPKDIHKFIHIASSDRDQDVVNKLSVFTSELSDLGISISTGPVVGFRSRDHLLDTLEKDSIPLFYPAHFSKGKTIWPSNKKPNALLDTYPKQSDMWINNGAYIVVNRFSAKEEKRRIVATYFEEEVNSKFIAFENKLNVFHHNKMGASPLLMKGLYIYLNSTLLDELFRQFSGHTQVNATDLRNIHYPSIKQLKSMGRKISSTPCSQKVIDKVVDSTINSLL